MGREKVGELKIKIQFQFPGRHESATQFLHCRKIEMNIIIYFFNYAASFPEKWQLNLYTENCI